MDAISQTSRDTRQQILDAAAALFRQRGYVGVSLREIAGAAGMKAGSLYYHFASKEEMVAEILDQGIRSVHEEVERAVGSVPPGDDRSVLKAAILAHLTSLLRQSDYTSANIRIFGQVPESVRERNLEVRRAYEALWDTLLMRLAGHSPGRKPSRKIRSTRLLVLGALNATLEWFDPRRGSVDALAEQYTELLWVGFEKMIVTKSAG
jgi:TetR/AcrR family transcriptional regulator, cholesterol catabolism regulator